MVVSVPQVAGVQDGQIKTAETGWKALAEGWGLPSTERIPERTAAVSRGWFQCAIAKTLDAYSARAKVELAQHTATADGRTSGRNFPLRIPLPHSQAHAQTTSVIPMPAGSLSLWDTR